MKRFRIYLGRNIGKDKFVHQPHFNKFIAEVVTRRFEGFTLFAGTGFWEGVTEISDVIEIVADTSACGDIQAIASEYVSRFSQEAVMVTSESVEVDFITPKRDLIG